MANEKKTQQRTKLSQSRYFGRIKKMLTAGEDANRCAAFLRHRDPDGGWQSKHVNAWLSQNPGFVQVIEKVPDPPDVLILNDREDLEADIAVERRAIGRLNHNKKPDQQQFSSDRLEELVAEHRELGQKWLRGVGLDRDTVITDLNLLYQGLQRELLELCDPTIRNSLQQVLADEAGVLRPFHPDHIDAISLPSPLKRTTQAPNPLKDPLCCVPKLAEAITEILVGLTKQFPNPLGTPVMERIQDKPYLDEQIGYETEELDRIEQSTHLLGLFLAVEQMKDPDVPLFRLTGRFMTSEISKEDGLLRHLQPYKHYDE